MADLRFILGLIPSTEKIEAKDNALRKEYADLQAYEVSDELARYRELEAFVLSPEFKEIKKFIEHQKFKDTDEFKKLNRFNTLKKSVLFKNYFSVKDSRELSNLLAVEKSGEHEKLKALQDYIQSSEFSQEKNAVSSKEFKKSDAYHKYIEYKRLSKSASLKKYFKLKSSIKFVDYSNVADSADLTEYKELEQFVKSKEFNDVKAYMALSSIKKFHRSEEFNRLQEYLRLKKSEKVRWYFNTVKDSKFNEIKKWVLTFSDEFETASLDSTKWITRYYWGNKLMDQPYSMDSDPHFVTDGQNVKTSHSMATLTVKAQKLKGKAWNPGIGFFEKEFDYTSGLISSGESFRQQYGLFTAKIRYSSDAQLLQDWWLLADRIVPHVDIAKIQQNKLYSGYFYGNAEVENGIRKEVSSFKGGKITDKFFIYSMEWTPEKLEYKVNNLVVKTITSNIPNEPMYVIFSTGLAELPSGGFGSANMDIDWIRVYAHAE